MGSIREVSFGLRLKGFRTYIVAVVNVYMYNIENYNIFRYEYLTTS